MPKTSHSTVHCLDHRRFGFEPNGDVHLVTLIESTMFPALTRGGNAAACSELRPLEATKLQLLPSKLAIYIRVNGRSGWFATVSTLSLHASMSFIAREV